MKSENNRNAGKKELLYFKGLKSREKKTLLSLFESIKKSLILNSNFEAVGSGLLRLMNR